MITLGKLFDRLIKGGPKHQAKKALEREFKEKAAKARREKFQAGYLEGLKKRSYKEGKEKGLQKTGISGFFEKAGKATKALESGFGDFGIGGFGSDLDILGLDTRSRRTGKKKTKHHKKSKSKSKSSREITIKIER